MTLGAARKQAEAIHLRYGAGDLPVDVEAIAERIGAPVIYDDLGSEDISGLLISNDAGACIMIQRSHHPKRRRFSIAHEIGHFVLRHQSEHGEHVHVDRGNYISFRDARSSKGVDAKEMEANAFASSLLMPEALVRRMAQELTQGRPLLDHHVSALASQFEVSEQAMTIRLTTLGLL